MSATYTIETWVLGDADTIITVYDGSTQKGSNDDKVNGDCGSKLTFKPTVSKTYTLKVSSYNNKTGANRGYNVSIATTALPPPPVTLPQPRKKWTVMVYLDGDNNQSTHSSRDMEEMETVGSTSDFDIVVLWDNTSSIHGYHYVQNAATTLLNRPFFDE